MVVMKRIICGLVIIAVGIIAWPVYLMADSVEESFKKMFPNISVQSISPTEIRGLYEVVSQNQIGYFAPEPGYLIIGEIFDRTGVNLTAKRRNEAISAKAKDLPLEKAVRIGNGKNVIIEFTDPDCPYCRRASTFLKQKTDLSRYIFFLPLPMHKDAENKIKYILCAENQAQAYEEAMQGKLDNKKYEVCGKPDVAEMVRMHKDAATRMGINSTPFFIVNGVPVSGANTAEIDKALARN